MTDIEQKALALVNEVADCRYETDDFGEERRDTFKALCRAIEQHEAFRQEVSDAVENCRHVWPEGWALFEDTLERFIIFKPVDPLVEAAKRAWPDISAFQIEQFREAFEHFGYEIREKADDHPV